MTVWVVVLLGGVATYFLRTSFIVFMGNRTLPMSVERALRYVGPAAFAAIAMPGIFGSNSGGDLWMPDERIVAATQADANLDDLVLALVHRARTEEGFTLTRAHLEEEYSRLTGDALGPWLDQYVYGRGDLPLPGYVLGR